MGLAASRQEAFWEACGFGHTERARQFLEAGDVDVNWVSYTNDCCPIHVASQGKPEIVELLLKYKCDVNVRDNRGNLPLHHAAMKGHADIVKTLIDAGSEIDTQEKNGWTPLHNAAYWCQPEVVRVLIKSGCNVNIQNKDQRTALHECARSQCPDNAKLGLIATMLIDAGSDVNAKSSDRGEADLTGLMYAAYHNHPEVASALIVSGCHLDDVGSTFWSALHWAADRGHDELVYILLEAGADPTRKGMRGETALDRAQSEEVREVISTAMTLYRELHKVSLSSIPTVLAPRPKPVSTYTPKCDANFKSESFLPKDWKPTTSPVDIKNLINEKKSRLAAMTSQQYRNDLAVRTGVKKPITDSGDSVCSPDKESNDAWQAMSHKGDAGTPGTDTEGSTDMSVDRSNRSDAEENSDSANSGADISDGEGATNGKVENCESGGKSDETGAIVESPRETVLVNCTDAHLEYKAGIDAGSEVDINIGGETKKESLKEQDIDSGRSSLDKTEVCNTAEERKDHCSDDTSEQTDNQGNMLQKDTLDLTNVKSEIQDIVDELKEKEEDIIKEM